MKKGLFLFFFTAVLAGAAVCSQAVPAWRSAWDQAVSYESGRKDGEKGNSRGKDQAAETYAEDELPKEISLYAQSAVLMDGDSGRILYGKNEKEIRPMASTTKIMTCILALELGHGEDIVTISGNAAAQPQVHLGAPAGRRFRLKDLLYSLMLESHNDTAVAIAEHIGGSVEGFAELMNQKARDIGCRDTYFITPNGLDGTVKKENGEERTHATTAADLARIMRYCTSQSPQKEEFLDITGTAAYTFSDQDKKASYSCVNHNALLTMMEGVCSGKTGFTSGAGYCYVGALRDGERNFIVALLGCGWPPHKTYKWTDARKLLQYGLDHYQYKNVWKDVEIPAVTVENAVPEDGDISHMASVHAAADRAPSEGLKLLLRQEEEPSVSLKMKTRLKAPVYQGDVIGQIEYRLQGQIVASYPVYLTEGAEAATVPWCLKKIFDSYLE